MPEVNPIKTGVFAMGFIIAKNPINTVSENINISCVIIQIYL
jgi:hypothetical protein